MPRKGFPMALGSIPFVADEAILGKKLVKAIHERISCGFGKNGSG